MCAASEGKYFDSNILDPVEPIDTQETAVLGTAIQFGILTPASTPTRPQITTCSTIISRQENCADIITRSVDTRRNVQKGKCKRMRSVSSDEEVEIVKITKRKGKGKGEREGSSDSDIVCVGHTLDLTI
jgi:hypothetical protein